MRTLTQARLVGLLAASAGTLVLAGCGASPAKTHRGAEAERTECRPTALRVLPGPPVSAPTQQLLLVFVLRNDTPDACSVRAAPRITLYSQQGSELPFDYRAGALSAHRRLTIDAHARVFLVITKHPCTLHASSSAASLGLGLARGAALRVRLPSAGALDYCGAKDPTGHMVRVLPFARTLKSLLAGAQPTGG